MWVKLSSIRIHFYLIEVYKFLYQKNNLINWLGLKSHKLFERKWNPKNISYEDYPKGYTLYAFNITPDLCSLHHFNMQKTGDISAYIKFNKATEVPINAVIYMEFDNIIEITKNRTAINNII